MDVEVARVDQRRKPDSGVVWINEQLDVVAPMVGQCEGNRSHIVADPHDDLVWTDLIVTRVCARPPCWAHWAILLRHRFGSHV